MTLLHLNEFKYFILIDKENKLLRFFQKIPFKWDHSTGRILPVYKKAKKKKIHKTEIWEKIENTPFVWRETWVTQDFTKPYAVYMCCH